MPGPTYDLLGYKRLIVDDHFSSTPMTTGGTATMPR
jgi:hypothetical protein